MPSRRQHTKSRHGCTQCKASHVKCDQGRPSCGTCNRREKKCTYNLGAENSLYRDHHSTPSFTSTAASTPPDAHSFRGTSPSAALPSSDLSASPTPGSTHSLLQQQETPPSIAWEDLELLHHFTVSTCSKFSNIPSIVDLWRVTVPQDACSYPFLMHSLLGFSALHLAYLNPNKKSAYLDSASRHHALSLPSYRLQLENISESNISAIFACSIFISLYTLALPICTGFIHLSRQSKEIEIRNPVQQIIRSLSLFQGSSVIGKSAWPLMTSSSLSLLFNSRFTSLSSPPNLDGLHPSTKAACVALDSYISSSASIHPKERESYLQATECLQKVMQLMGTSDTDNGVVLSWPFLLTDTFDFVGLLTKQRPIALVILAYYGVALHKGQDDWYFGGWGRQLVLDVDKILGTADLADERRQLMAWPLEATNDTVKVG